MAVFRLFNFNSYNALGCRSLLSSRSTLKCSEEQHATYGSFKGLESVTLEKLGIPSPPKKPLSPYFMFIKEIRPKIIQNQPDLKSKEIVKVMAEEWRNCDPELKKTYQKKYLLQMQEHLAELEKYKESITPEQKNLIESAKSKQKQAVEHARISAKQEQLGKPKKGLSPFLLFLLDKKADRRSDEKYNLFVKEMSQEWKNIPENLKERYVTKSKAEMEKYKKELLKWEEKMIREGHLDVVRSKNILGSKSDKKTSKNVET